MIKKIYYIIRLLIVLPIIITLIFVESKKEKNLKEKEQHESKNGNNI